MRARPLQPSRAAPCGPGGAARPCSLPRGGAAPPLLLPRGGAARPCSSPAAARPCPCSPRGGPGPGAWPPAPRQGPLCTALAPGDAARPPARGLWPPCARLPSPLACGPSAPYALSSRPRCTTPVLGSVDPGAARVASVSPRAPPFTPTRSRVRSPTRAVIFSWFLINFKLRLVSVLRRALHRATNLFNFRFY
jgi:hypothetical protein